MRILPHHQDTGGFFVAVLEKVKSLPWESEAYILNQNVQNLNDNENKDGIPEEENKDVIIPKEENKDGIIPKEKNKDRIIPKEETSRDEFSESGKRILEEEKKTRELQRKRRRIVGYREDPFVFFKDETEDVWQSIK